MNTPEQSQLGKASAYIDQYDASLLFPIPRAGKRAEIGITGAAPFFGADLWTAFELSWLNQRGKPQVALAHITVPCETPNIVGSKSFKLYLNSFNQERVGDIDALRDVLARDVSAAAGAAVGVTLVPAGRFGAQRIAELDGECIDAIDVAIDDYGPPRADYLGCGAGRVEETLVSHLLKSNCPVTGQPDWASVQIRYAGAPLDRGGLLRYLVSFRDHAGFHEQCVERIFADITRRCAPERLAVYARYTRRGGLDINPWRGSSGSAPDNLRGARQ